jgi:hypothetical protein
VIVALYCKVRAEHAYHNTCFPRTKLEISLAGAVTVFSWCKEHRNTGEGKKVEGKFAPVFNSLSTAP